MIYFHCDKYTAPAKCRTRMVAHGWDGEKQLSGGPHTCALDPEKRRVNVAMAAIRVSFGACPFVHIEGSRMKEGLEKVDDGRRIVSKIQHFTTNIHYSISHHLLTCIQIILPLYYYSTSIPLLH